MYRPVPPDLDLPALERRVLRFWDESGAFEHLRRTLAGSPRRFSFIDGPITANNPMGVHHAWGRTYKDLFQRYHAMLGEDQRFQNGFDCQGLWVEVEVEKELGFASKRDIEAYGIAEFVQRCKERVLTYARVISEQSQRLGYWMDWSDSYFTMSDENNYTIWHVLKTCHERGWLYRGHDVMPWCPRCSTGISQMEIDTEGYQETTHTSVYARLPLLDAPDGTRESLLVWTTTPWTLPANVAAAVHPELTYAFARRGDDTVILAEPLVRRLGAGWDVVRRVRGHELVGRRYRGPFDDLPAQQGVEHRVVPWDEVAQDEGTGIVHIAPGCGEEDFQLGREFGLPAIAPIDDLGIYVDGFGWLTGRSVQDVAEPIVADLRSRGLLLRAEPYKHRYPHCWRCRTQLVFRLVDEWYIRVGDGDDPDSLRSRLMAVTRQIRWLPEFGLERELDWLRNMHDWMISKKRYWGLALPFWVCDGCGRFEVVGSREELRSRAVEGWDTFEGHSPHRPWVDAVKIACSGCGAAISRVPDVGNPWLDAGIVAYSTLGYRSDHATWERWFPADFITESFPGQYRNWFYAMLVMSTVLENRPPFRAVLGHGVLRDERGQAMHKSLGNAIAFDEAAERAGADALRWIFSQHNPAANVNFGWKVAEDATRRLLTLWHSYRFFVDYARVEGWRPGPSDPPPAARPELDRWLLGRLQALARLVRERLDGIDAMNAARAIEEFFDDLSNWYIRRSRPRFWAPGGRAEPAALATLHEALVTLARLMAPFTPFLAEELYGNLVRAVDADAPESVHLTAFPEPDPALEDAALVEAMEWTRLVASLGHAARKGAGIRTRQPLPVVRVAGGSRFHDLPAWAVPLLEDELNVKRVEFARELREAVRQRVEPNPKLLGPKYGKDYPRIRAALQAGAFEVREDGRVVAADVLLAPEEVTISLEPASDFAAAADRGVLVVLDTTLTPELRAEGHAREVVRLIQAARKEADYALDDRIEVRFEAADGLAGVFDAFADYIRRETLATRLENGEAGAAPASASPQDGWHRARDEIDGLSVVVAVRRAGVSG